VPKRRNTKNPHCCGFFELKYLPVLGRLFDFVFFVWHMLAHDWIILFELELVRRALFVLVCGVKMAGVSG
jgi:hypothetical protein